MNKIVVAIVVIALLAVASFGAYIYLSNNFTTQPNNVTYLGLSFTSSVVDAPYVSSPSISSVVPSVTLETYRTNYGLNGAAYSDEWNNNGTTDEWNATFSTFNQQYILNITMIHTVYVYENNSGSLILIYSKNSTFTTGVGRTLSIWFSNSIVPEGTVLEIQVYWYFTATLTNLSTGKVVETNTYTYSETFYTQPIENNYTSNNPLVTINGQLVMSSNGYYGIAIDGRTIEPMQSQPFVDSSWNLTSTPATPTPLNVVLLYYNGAHVTDVTPLNCAIGDPVIATENFVKLPTNGVGARTLVFNATSIVLDTNLYAQLVAITFS